MNNDCVFYKQSRCRLKQKDISALTCFSCMTFYQKDNEMTLKDWYAIANTNKNVRLQIFITIFSLSIALFALYDKHQITLKQNLLLQEMKIETTRVDLIKKQLNKLEQKLTSNLNKNDSKNEKLKLQDSKIDKIK